MQTWEWNERIEPTNRSIVSLCYLKGLRSHNTDSVFSFALSYCTRETLYSLVDVFQSNLNALNVWFKYTTAHCKDRSYNASRYQGLVSWFCRRRQNDSWHDICSLYNIKSYKRVFWHCSLIENRTFSGTANVYTSTLTKKKKRGDQAHTQELTA